MKGNTIVIPDAAYLAPALSDAVLKELTDHRWKVFTQDMVGHGRNFTIRKGNIFLGFFGCNRAAKLSVFNRDDDLIAELKCSFLGLHVTLLILLLLMIPPLHIGVLIALTPFGWLFIAAHIVGLILQIIFLRKLRMFITEYCKTNAASPCFCPKCGSRLNALGKCDRCDRGDAACGAPGRPESPVIVSE